MLTGSGLQGYGQYGENIRFSSLLLTNQKQIVCLHLQLLVNF